jgi:hypothetical protein
VAEDRIKSAREIAMERLASLSALTPEELDEQRKKEYGPRGAAIAQKYLEGTLRSSELARELKRYQGKDGEAVRKAFVSTLCESIGLQDVTKSMKAIDGIAAVAGKVDPGEMKREIETISGEFIREAERRRAEYTDLMRQKLVSMGISGSAVWPNVAEDDDWRRELKRIGVGYSERADVIREKLSELPGL